MLVLKAAQEKLFAALQSVAGIVERRHTLPILANVMLRKEAGRIEFTTSDLEIQVRTSAELDGDERELRHHRRRAQADRHPSLAAGRPDGVADLGAVQAHAAGRPQPLHAADAAGRGFPAGAGRGRFRPGVQRPAGHPQAADRPGAFRDGGARHPLLPQRHPVRRRGHAPHAGRHRRPPAGAGRGDARGRDSEAGSHPAEKDRARAAAPAQGRQPGGIEARGTRCQGAEGRRRPAADAAGRRRTGRSGIS